ncbi:MAG: transporter [Firmicutes bacterium]|nr:transporter [Bacillota bacterium]
MNAVNIHDTNPKEQGAYVKWHALFGGFMSYILDALDFMLLAMALPFIMKELNLSMAEAGLLGTATLIGVGFSSVVMGWYSDNYGRKNALMGSLLAFGLLTAAIGFSRGFYDVMILRFLAGLGLGGVWGVAAAYINETWPAHQRGRAASFVLSSWPIGFGLAALLAGYVLPRYGWRVLFFCGVISVVVVAYIYFFIPESESWKEQKRLRMSNGEKNSKISISEVFAPEVLRYTIFGTLSASCALIAYWGVNTWIPTFLIKERGMSMTDMSMFIVMLNVGMFIGYQVFGYLADKIGRKKSLIISFIGATIMVPIYSVAESTTLLFWLGPVMALFFSYAGMFGSYFAELYPLRIRSLGAGFCFNVGRGLSAFAPFVLGQIAATYSLSIGIGLCGLSFLVAGIMMMFLPETKQAAA